MHFGFAMLDANPPVTACVKIANPNIVISLLFFDLSFLLCGYVYSGNIYSY
jgi:hypothetical protein